MSAPQRQLVGERVLLAVDDSQFSAQLSQSLWQLGAQIIDADNGADALRTVVNYAFHHRTPIGSLVVTLSLPRLNGLSVLRNLHANGLLNGLTVIVVWKPEEQAMLAKCREFAIAGDVAHSTPPGDVARLLSRLAGESRARAASQKYSRSVGHAPCSGLCFPFLFGGLPRQRSYALRPSFYRCPFCGTTFTAPRLVTRALQPAADDYMGVGLYSRGMDRDYLEYLLIECFSCPDCLFTFDRSGFFASSVNGESPLTEVEQLPDKEWRAPFFSVNSRLQDTVAKTIPERLATLSKASLDGHGLFAIHEGDPAVPRLPGDALIAYDLARMSAETILPAQQKGEEQARLYHKISGFHIKQYYVHGMLAKSATGAQAASERQAQGQALLAALAAVNQVRDVEFNVLEECLYCQTRRFFIADLLCASAANDEQKTMLANLRKRAFSAMKGTLIRVRQAKDKLGINTVERFMQPLENRMLELENESKR